jgi:endonuclease/exonuclease/phosphatase family metal-dependent hydrolase
VLLTGDFNTKPEEDPIQLLATTLQNARAISKQKYGPVDTWNGFQFQQKPNGCIDFIFVSKQKRIQVSKFATITDSYDLKYPSDHFPIMATITIQKQTENPEEKLAQKIN